MVSYDYISIKDLSMEMGMHRSHLARYVRDIGIEPVKRRTHNSSGHLTLTVSKLEAEKIIKKREEDGFLGSSNPVETGFGFFYVIQVVPELCPNRVKIGFAQSLKTRLSQHKISAPTSKIIYSWKCKRSWEHTIIDYIKKLESNFIGGEVYEFTDLKILKNHIDILMDILN